jgi:MFS family permease
MIFFALSSLIAYVVGSLEERISGRDLLLKGLSESKRGKEGYVSAFFLLTLALAISYVSVMSVGDIAYVYYKEVLGLSEGSTALLRGLSNFFGTLVAFFLGWLADRGEAKKVLIGSYMLSILGALFISVPNVAVAVMGIITITVSSRIFFPVARKVASEMPRGNVYIGLLGTLGNVGAALGGIGFGYLYTTVNSKVLRFLGLTMVKAPLLATLWMYLILLIIIVKSVMKHSKNRSFRLKERNRG